MVNSEFIPSKPDLNAAIDSQLYAKVLAQLARETPTTRSGKSCKKSTKKGRMMSQGLILEGVHFGYDGAPILDNIHLHAARTVCLAAGGQRLEQIHPAAPGRRPAGAGARSAVLAPAGR